MPRRTVWLVTGVVAGAASSLYAERKLRRTLEAAQARLQPDALAVEVGRTARQAVSSTGDRVREAVVTARQEKRRRESELWTELEEGREGRTAPGSLGGGAVPDPPGPPTARSDDAPTVPGRLVPRRLRRIARNEPSRLGH